jgi:hypothetical protein
LRAVARFQNREREIGAMIIVRHPLGPALQGVAIGRRQQLMRWPIAVSVCLHQPRMDVRRSLALATITGYHQLFFPLAEHGGRERHKFLLLAHAGDTTRARWVMQATFCDAALSAALNLLEKIESSPLSYCLPIALARASSVKSPIPKNVYASAMGLCKDSIMMQSSRPSNCDF